MPQKTALGDLILGLVGTAIAVALLMVDSALFDLHTTDADILGAVFLLAAAGQATPMLGLAIATRALLLQSTRARTPRIDDGSRLRASENIVVVAVFAFGLAFLGVFALLYSIVFVPLIALAVIGNVLYKPLASGNPSTRSIFRVLSLSAIGFGALCLALYAVF